MLAILFSIVEPAFSHYCSLQIALETSKVTAHKRPVALSPVAVNHTSIIDDHKKMNVTLKEFLTDARFGSVIIGMSKAEVLEHAGQPGEFSRGTCLEDAEIWSNGCLTFWFKETELDRIGVYFSPVQMHFAKNENIKYDNCFPTFGTKLSNIIDFLEQEGIEFSTATALHTHITTRGGVEILGIRDGELLSIVYPPVITGKSAKRNSTAI